MKKRCFNPNVKCYPRYGGRGISVCREWKTDFKAFYTWATDNGKNAPKEKVKELKTEVKTLADRYSQPGGDYGFMSRGRW